MTDQTVGHPPVVSPRSGAPTATLFGLRLPVLGLRAGLVTAGLATLALLAYANTYEGWWPHFTFAVACTMLIGFLILLATRRLLFSSILATGITSVIVAVASAKRQAMDMVLHAYDVFFYMRSWSTVSYLWSDHRIYIYKLVAALAAVLLAGWFAWRMDGSRVPRVVAAGCCLVAACFAAIGADTKGERRHTQFYWSDLFLNSFYESWRETVETLWRGTLIEAAQSQNAPLFRVPPSCNTMTKPPHIILVHEESIVQPSLFPKLDYDRRVDPFFNSFDGRLHKMRVETYGGASWLTEFSILAGVSTQSFGGMRQFVQALMAGKVHDTLPQSLTRCGYRNVVFYPMQRNFVSNAKFFTAAGMPEILDQLDQGAPTVNERDRFYFDNAMKLMQNHFAASQKPLFTFIETMSAHSPYGFKWKPEVDVPGGGPGTDPEMHEYLRRLSMSKMDYDYFRAELVKRFPKERFLIVHYGDHHPMATRTLLGQSSDLDAEDVQLSPEGIGYITYYAVDGINYKPPPLPPVETLDVPYLGAVILREAGLPLSDAMHERERMMLVCGGAYFNCKRQDLILGFHRRLIDSGLIDAR